MRAGQPFAFRYPLVEVEGSYGNAIESGNWAASRYTASRLSKVSKALFADIEKETIDEWRDNYDDTMQYPAVLPSKGFYNIVNGTLGIGVGLASSIPQFNLREVNNALIKLIENPDATFEEIYCPPDFATGGILINEEVVKASLKAGNGKACMLRAKIEHDNKKNILTVVEIPYNVYTNTICKELEKIVNSEENPGIERFNDLTGLNPCIKIYLEKNANVSFIINYLYKNTSLQSSYGINMTMLEQGRFPKVFTWKQALQAHLEHEKEVYIRGFNYDLKKIAHKIKIDEAIIKAIAKIEEVIHTIKSSESTADANNKLQKLLNIDEEQAKAILDIKLAKLAKLEIEKYEKELVELKIEYDRILNILNSESLLNNEIIKGLKAIADKYGDNRRTEVTNITITKEEKEIEFVEDIPMMVLAYKNGIKTIPIESYRVQRKGTKGIKSENELLINSFKSSTQDRIYLFSNKGKMYGLLCNKIPAGNNTSIPSNYADLIKLEENEFIVAVSSLHRVAEKDTPPYIFFITQKGYIKKSNLQNLGTNRSTGTKVINLEDNDTIVKVIFMSEEQLILITKNGISIRFETKDIACVGKTAKGIMGIKLKPDDEVITALPIHKITDTVALITTQGIGKKVELKEFPIQNRYGIGTVCYKNNELAGALMIDDNDNILLSGITSLVISAKDIPLLNRTAIGNILSKNKVNKIAKI